MCFNVRKPTLNEYESLPRLTLTSRDLTWNPSSSEYAKAEAALLDSNGELKTPGDRITNKYTRQIKQISDLSIAALNYLQQVGRSASQGEAILHSIEPALNEYTYNTMLKENRSISATSTSNRKSMLTAEKLASTRRIPIKQAQNTLKVSTQRGIRHVANPTITRRFRSNDRMLRYKRIPHVVFTDTLKSSVKSRDQNQYAQVYCTDSRWTRVYTMKKESQAHETLS